MGIFRTRVYALILIIVSIFILSFGATVDARCIYDCCSYTHVDKRSFFGDREEGFGDCRSAIDCSIENPSKNNTAATSGYQPLGGMTAHQAPYPDRIRPGSARKLIRSGPPVVVQTSIFLLNAELRI